MLYNINVLVFRYLHFLLFSFNAIYLSALPLFSFLRWSPLREKILNNYKKYGSPVDSFCFWIGQTGSYYRFIMKMHRTHTTLRGLNPYLDFQACLGDR